jgi:hypothetical protein
MSVCHRCDVRACVNPAHLFLGTNTENQADMDTKGRRVAPGRYAALSERDVIRVKFDLVDGVPERRIAAKFGVTRPTIALIAMGKAWEDVPWPPGAALPAKAPKRGLAVAA